MHDVAWRGMWICVRSKDAQKQLARTSLMDRFGPDNFSTLQIKGHVLHRARAHLKVPA